MVSFWTSLWRVYIGYHSHRKRQSKHYIYFHWHLGICHNFDVTISVSDKWHVSRALYQLMQNLYYRGVVSFNWLIKVVLSIPDGLTVYYHLPMDNFMGPLKVSSYVHKLNDKYNRYLRASVDRIYLIYNLGENTCTRTLNIHIYTCVHIYTIFYLWPYFELFYILNRHDG